MRGERHALATAAGGVPAASGEDGIRAAIRAAIEDRRLAPGTRLVEEQLARIFGVSRARVRGALRELAHEHLVEVRRNRGACVAAPSPEEARQVFQARRLMEDMIIRSLAATRPPGAVERLRAHVAAEAAAADRGDRGAGIRLSGEFHLLLAGAMGNSILAAFLRDLVARSSLIIALYERRSAANCSAEDHARLIALVAAGDAEGAAAEMARHLGEIEDRLDLEEEDAGAVDLRAVFSAPVQP